MALTVAVTGPTGEIGKPLMAELERRARSGGCWGWRGGPSIRRPRAGRRSSTGAGTSSTAGRSTALFDGRRRRRPPRLRRSSAAARRRREINLEGTRNVFEAAIDGRRQAARLHLLGRRLRLPPGQPAAADRGRRRRAAATGFYYSAQKAELEGLLDELLDGSEVEAYVFRPCIVAGPRATMLIEQTVDAVAARRPAAAAAPRRSTGCRCCGRCCPTPACRSSSSTTTTSPGALAAAICGDGAPGVYNLAGEGEITGRRHRPRARLALGAGAATSRSASRAEPLARLSFLPAEARVGEALPTRRC